MKDLVVALLVWVLSLIAAPVFAQSLYQPGPGAIPGCPLSGCQYTGPIDQGITTSTVPNGGDVNGWYLNSGALILSSNVLARLDMDQTKGSAAPSNIGQISAYQQNSANAQIIFGRIRMESVSTTAGSEAGRTRFYANTAGSLNEYLRIDPKLVSLIGDAMLLTAGTVPAVTGTGTPTISASATNTAGEVTGGTASTTETVTFVGGPLSKAPFCTVTFQTQLAAATYTISTTAITTTHTALTGIKWDYICIQH